MSKNFRIPPLHLIKKGAARLSDVWSSTQKGRFIKQHGDVEKIPEGDAHAVPQYNSPVDIHQPSQEEISAAEVSLEKKIKEIKEQGSTPVPPQPKGNNFYDQWDD